MGRILKVLAIFFTASLPFAKINAPEPRASVPAAIIKPVLALVFMNSLLFSSKPGLFFLPRTSLIPPPGQDAIHLLQRIQRSLSRLFSFVFYCVQCIRNAQT